MNFLRVVNSTLFLINGGEIILSTPYNRNIQAIVIHHMGDGKSSDISILNRWNPYNYEYPEYDFGVEADGTIRQGRPLNYQGAHCLSDKPPHSQRGDQWWNQNSIGIGVAGDFTKFPMSQAQFNSLVGLVKKLMSQYNLTLDDCYPHGQITFTACPGCIYDKVPALKGFWNYNDFENAVQSISIIQTSPPSPTPTPSKHLVMGKSEITITVEQAETYLHKINPDAPYFARIYKEEAEIEGVRWDLAFSQACKESNHFRFGGIAKPEWNNFAGIGITGVKSDNPYREVFIEGVTTVWTAADKKYSIRVEFVTARLGIRCQIQHLKAYSSSNDLVNQCVDPRFKYVKRNIAPYIEDYGNGVWASDPDNYGGKIWDIVCLMKSTVVDNSQVQRGYKMKNLVVVKNGIDEKIAFYLSWKYNAPIVYADSLLQDDIYNTQTVFEVGGTQTIPNSVFISGTDRYKTMEKVVKYINSH